MWMVVFESPFELTTNTKSQADEQTWTTWSWKVSATKRLALSGLDVLVKVAAEAADLSLLDVRVLGVNFFY
jgi:hypothetical protein